MLRWHRYNILAYLTYRIAKAATQRLNAKIQWI